jgi:glutamine synthetase
MVDGVWSGGTYVCWGTDNREAPVRLCNATGLSRNLEIKCIDGTASPYLALAGILAAGLDGIRERKPLTMKDCDGKTSAANMSEEERKEAGIDRRLPLDLADAISSLKDDEVLRKALGEEFVEAYVSMNKVSTFIRRRTCLVTFSCRHYRST